MHVAKVRPPSPVATEAFCSSGGCYGMMQENHSFITPQMINAVAGKSVSMFWTFAWSSDVKLIDL
jgi:hypothetical protein